MFALICCSRAPRPRHRAFLRSAQCRPLATTQCHQWSASDAEFSVGESDAWLCAGWEQCATNYGECTRSRCCASAGYGCFLNQSLLDEGGGWHAFCEPGSAGTGRSDTTRVQIHTVGENEAILTHERNLSSVNVSTEMFFYTQVSAKHAFCEGSAEWRCLQLWQEHAKEFSDFMNEKAIALIDASGLTPAGVAGIGLGSAAMCLATSVFAFLYRRRVSARVIKLEKELAEMREAKRQANEKKRGGEQGISLVGSDEAAADEVLE